ncbi:hypothetical protein GPN2_10546 [Streptomyces murinus]
MCEGAPIAAGRPVAEPVRPHPLHPVDTNIVERQSIQKGQVPHTAPPDRSTSHIRPDSRRVRPRVRPR